MKSKDMEQLDDIGFPPVYAGRQGGHIWNTPLWSRPYTYCQSDADCGVNAGGSGPRCMGLGFSLKCERGDTCICSNAVNASRLNRQRR
jgi:hypothetical protein